MKIGTTELLIILAIVLVLFGPKQLPKLTRMFGKGVRDVRKGMEESTQDKIESEEKSGDESTGDAQ